MSNRELRLCPMYFLGSYIQMYESRLTIRLNLQRHILLWWSVVPQINDSSVQQYENIWSDSCSPRSRFSLNCTIIDESIWNDDSGTWSIWTRFDLSSLEVTHSILTQFSVVCSTRMFVWPVERHPTDHCVVLNSIRCHGKKNWYVGTRCCKYCARQTWTTRRTLYKSISFGQRSQISKTSSKIS